MDPRRSFNEKTWAEAITYCEGLNIHGLSNWKLPDKFELINAFDQKILDASGWEGVSGDNLFWASTVVNNDKGNLVDLATGIDTFMPKKKRSIEWYALWIKLVATRSNTGSMRWD